MNGGKELMRAVGMAGKMAAGTQPAEQQLQADTAGRLSARHRPQNKRPQMAGLAAKQQLPQTMLACRAGKWGECRGTGSHQGGCGPTYTCPYPTYRLCLSLSLPTPLICKTQFGPKLTFFFFRFYFTPYFPTMISSLTLFNVTVRLTSLSPTLLPTPTVPSQRGTREG